LEITYPLTAPELRGEACPEAVSPRPFKWSKEHVKNHVTGFFKVDEYAAEFERYARDGGGSGQLIKPPHNILVKERGDSVAALLYDRSAQEVVLVEQFRLPVALRGEQAGKSGWITELPAGALKAESESPDQCIKREIEEETGYQVSSLAKIAEFFLSPGGSTERILLFFAEVRKTGTEKAIGGNPKSGENTRVVREKLEVFYRKLRNREYEDAKLIIGGYWLRDRLAGLKFGTAANSQSFKYPILPPTLGSWWGKPRTNYIGYISGDIIQAQGVDVWVNPLTANMELDKFTDRTFSASIRAAGAKKDEKGNLISDDIGDALRRKKNGRHFVRTGEVLATTAGDLSGQVKQIVHVAIADTELNVRPKARIEDIEKCVRSVLDHIATETRHDSVAFPLIGTGEEGLPVGLVSHTIVTAVLQYLKSKPRGGIKEVYLVPYTTLDVFEVESALVAAGIALNTGIKR